MIVTEKEASTKRCQESFGDTNLGSGYIEARAVQMGTQAFATSPINCMGSACMAWRWAQKPNLDFSVHNVEAPAWLDTDKGYCGKAGG